MGKIFDAITPELQQWIGYQKIFFVSTAPLSADGHINCSPKGLDSFRVLDPRTVVYRDLTGSGIETISHLRENKRIVVLFTAFEGPPKIVRLHGHGEVISEQDPEFARLSLLFQQRLGVRAYIKITLSRISDSCGYSVPLYEYVKDRDVLDKWCEHKGEEGIRQYRSSKNTSSIDGLKGL